MSTVELTVQLEPQQIIATIEYLTGELKKLLNVTVTTTATATTGIIQKPVKLMKPARKDMSSRLVLLNDFLEKWTKVDSKCSVRATDLRNKFNSISGCDESHISFSRLMTEYLGDSKDINYKPKGDAKYYVGLGLLEAAIVG